MHVHGHQHNMHDRKAVNPVNVKNGSAEAFNIWMEQFLLILG